MVVGIFIDIESVECIIRMMWFYFEWNGVSAVDRYQMCRMVNWVDMDDHIVGCIVGKSGWVYNPHSGEVVRLLTNLIKPAYDCARVSDTFIHKGKKNKRHGQFHTHASHLHSDLFRQTRSHDVGLHLSTPGMIGCIPYASLQFHSNRLAHKIMTMWNWTQIQPHCSREVLKPEQPWYHVGHPGLGAQIETTGGGSPGLEWRALWLMHVQS